MLCEARLQVPSPGKMIGLNEFEAKGKTKRTRLPRFELTNSGPVVDKTTQLCVCVWSERPRRRLINTGVSVCGLSIPVVDEAVDTLLPEDIAVVVVVVVLTPAEHHQAFGLGLLDEAGALQELLCVGTDSLEGERETGRERERSSQ